MIQRKRDLDDGDTFDAFYDEDKEGGK